MTPEHEQAQRPRIATLANFYTALRFAITPVFVVSFLAHTRIGLVIAFVCAVVALLSDYLDGYYARKYKTVSGLGKIFDPLADAFFFLAVFLSFAAAGVIPVWLTLPFVVRELTQHLYVRPMALLQGEAVGAKFVGKFKTACQCVAALLVVFLEIIRGYDTELLRWFRTDELFMWFDRIAFLAIAITAIVSVYSLFPYLSHLRRLSARNQAAQASSAESAA